MRESRRGEKLVTLDGMERELPEGVIVIEDNEGRLIDLCGIMGAKNSEVDENTKRVLLFLCRPMILCGFANLQCRWATAPKRLCVLKRGLILRV